MTCPRLACAVGAALLAVLSATSCKDENPVNGESPSNIIFPADSVSYGRHVEPLFRQTCSLIGCHDDGNHPSALKLTTYDNLMYGSLQVVVRGQPNQSVLVWRIEGRVGRLMPMNRNPLNQNQINGIRAWIAEGAKNN